MKILLLSHKFWPDVGGIESISEMLAEAFVDEGHEVRIATWSVDAKDSNFRYKVIRKPKLSVLLKNHMWADVVFENNICLRLSWPSALLFKKTVIGLQTWISDTNKTLNPQGWIKKMWLKRASKVVACSDAIRTGCWPNAEIVGNPYQEKVFKILPDVDRTGHFVFVGRLVSDKGVDIAIRAIEHLIKNSTFGNRVFNIIGDGPEKPVLQKLIREAGLQDKINLLGEKRGEALVQCLNNHRYILVPSTWEEPFGIVALEGLACGCLPIVSNSGGLPDAVGDCGLTFKSGDSVSLAETIAGILENEQLERKLQLSAANHLKKHTSRQIARRYLSIMQGLLFIFFNATSFIASYR